MQFFQEFARFSATNFESFLQSGKLGTFLGIRGFFFFFFGIWELLCHKRLRSEQAMNETNGTTVE